MREVRGLTGLRGIAALMVFWAHIKEQLQTFDMGFHLPLLLERLLFSGGRQVDVFFVLSGFVMTLVYRTWFDGHPVGANYAVFMRRRMARIYPLHVFFLLLVVGATILVHLLHLELRHGLDRFNYATLPQHVLLIHGWGTFMPAPGTWNPPSWSISIEFLAYLIFPLVIWAMQRLSRFGPWPAIATCAVLGLAGNALFSWQIMGVGAIVRGLTEFFLGCAVALATGGRLSAWLMGRWGSIAAAGLMLLAYALVADTGFVIALACAPLLLTLCGDNPVSRVLGARPLHFLGEISYSVYLGHFLFSSLAYRVIGPAWMAESAWHALAGGLTLTVIILALSSITYYWVELPARRWLSGRRPVATSGAHGSA